jgi:cyclophilin family peptidyl-prolyl cis-trans isomerase
VVRAHEPIGSDTPSAALHGHDTPLASHAVRGAIVPLLLLVAIAASGCGGDDGGTSSASGCESVQLPAARKPETMKPPRKTLDKSKSYSLTFETSCGTFVVGLDTKRAPNNSASLVELARAGYFDDTIFHRIVPGFVIQGGDPTQTGAGGPGYTMLDQPPANARYTKGTVAMAKTASDPAGLSGSQFFIVTAGDAGLPPDYAIVGKVTRGMDVVDRIGQLGDQTEHATQPVVISTVTVGEGA